METLAWFGTYLGVGNKTPHPVAGAAGTACLLSTDMGRGEDNADLLGAALAREGGGDPSVSDAAFGLALPPPHPLRG